MSLARFNSKWTSAFLTPSLQAQTISIFLLGSEPMLSILAHLNLSLGRNSLLIYAGLLILEGLLPLLAWINVGMNLSGCTLSLDRVIHEYQQALVDLFFSSWPYPMGFFQTDLWTGLCLLSWSPGLWFCFLLCFILSGFWISLSHEHPKVLCPASPFSPQ